MLVGKLAKVVRVVCKEVVFYEVGGRYRMNAAVERAFNLGI